MIKNRISKYFRPTEPETQPEPPRVNPSAFIAMPGMGGIPGQPNQGMPQGPLSIYDIALAEAQRRIAESRAQRANEIDFEDLSGWFDSSF
jgi:hypothetical protein